MSHDHEADPAVMWTQEFWDERYGSATTIWSGNPNPHLVARVADLRPGTALDVGSGEGADAIWLAEQGWQVTGIDVSMVALERAAQLAAAAGQDVADRITWQQADILTWDPAPRQFDLVSAQFMHLPRSAREVVYRRLAAAVRPDGSLLMWVTTRQIWIRPPGGTTCPTCSSPPSRSRPVLTLTTGRSSLSRHPNGRRSTPRGDRSRSVTR